MSYIFKILSEHAELTGEKVMLNWQIEQYETLINELMAYLCQEDTLGKQYLNRYSNLLRIRKEREENDRKEKKMTDKQTSLDERTLKLKVEMDQLVEKIKELDTAILELNELFKMRSELLKKQYEEKRYELEQKKDKQEGYLRELFEQVPQSETKIQRKVKLLSGDVVVKKSKLDFKKNNDKLLEWAKANQREDLISRKEILTFK